jgi:glutaredoxin
MWTNKYPHLIEQWDPTKNGGTRLENLLEFSHTKAWWHCSECGGDWFIGVKNRTANKSGCPYCTRRKLLVGFNDLATVHPELIPEWHFNNVLKPNQVIAGSTYRAMWICSNGHSYEAAVRNKVVGRGCPYCDGKKIIQGYNDLATSHPELVSEWHPIFNGSLKPTDVAPGSKQIVHWMCSKGHEWSTRVKDRTYSKRPTGCPYCHKATSYPERKVFYFVKNFFPDAQASFKDKANGISELDIFIPSLKTGVEYDGVRYHGNKKRDQIKNKACRESKIRLIRIRELGCPNIRGEVIKVDTSEESLNQAIAMLLSKLNINDDVDFSQYNRRKDKILHG